MKLASAQYPIAKHDSLNAWKDHVQKWVNQACKEKAKLLVFPEYGSMELVSFLSEEVQRSLPSQIQEMQKSLPFFIETFKDLAEKNQVAIVAPSFPVVDSRFIKPVNRAYFFYPDGRHDFQDKIHMTRFEDEVWGVGPGLMEYKIFDVFGVKIGIAICFDVEFPFAPLELAKKGIQILTAPSCTESLKGLYRVHVAARARALENQYYVAVAQTVGSAPWSEAVDINTGQAACYSTCDVGFPDDGILMQGKINDEGWYYCDLDPSLLEKVREQGQVFNFKNMRRYQTGLQDS